MAPTCVVMSDAQEPPSPLSIPDGYCFCGCGNKTGLINNKPRKYLFPSHDPNYRPTKYKKEPKAPTPKLKASEKEIIKPKSEIRGTGRHSDILAWMEVNQVFLADQRSLHGKERREGRRRYIHNRNNSDPEFRLLNNLRNRIYCALKGAGKSRRTTELIGCTISALRAHLEKNFTEGMSWENYGKWHVDHIIPCSSFDLVLPDEQRRCFHYTNLQPLWAVDNLKKNDRLPTDRE